jgi:aspartyl-tRNA(Asn)/glutamyl-tRNA(Gln) amidotransferase subunit B
MSQKVFETVVGLEVHAELDTHTKIFCQCENKFGAPPNTNTCPICLGHPGVLPVLNQTALQYAVKAALALNCEISRESKFDRKNYFYPDLTKAYQISQYDQPIGQNGWIEIEVEGQRKRIGITRLHLEEDAGKLTHVEGTQYSLVDYNRVGTPLIEIVSEPDIRSPQEAYAYLEKLKAILQYTEVSDCKMEEGSLRCDANISIRPFGQQAFGTRTELKNMNSFKGVQKGLEYEQQRQADVLLSGQQVVQETRRWDEARGVTRVMRGKEEAHDYRYFPDPDLVRMNISEEMLEQIKSTIPELPDARQQRYMKAYGLSSYDAGVITAQKSLADFFDQALTYCKDAKQVANWLMGDVLGYLNAEKKELHEVALSPETLGKLIGLIEKGTISGKIAKSIFTELMEQGGDPEQLVREKGLVQISDEDELQSIIKTIVDNNDKSVEDFKAGKTKAIGFLVGQVMKETKGKANPGVVNKLLQEELAQR